MKQLKFLILLCVCTIAFTSCEKDDDNNKSGSVTTPLPTGFGIKGFWEGTYGYGIVNNTFYYGINLLDRGQMQEIDQDGEQISTGTWVLQGTKFHCEYHPLTNLSVTYILEGEYSSSNHLLAGTWKYKHDTHPTGVFILKK